MKAFILLTVTFLFSMGLYAQQIILDEDFSDWESGATSFSDKSIDGSSSGIDFSDIRISNDDQYLFIYFRVGKEINIQEGNKISVYIDIDNSSTTGLSKQSIGADIVYNFGTRQGSYYTNNNVFSISHDEVELVTSPTVTSDRFELSFAIDSNLGKIGKTIKVLFSDENAGGDKAPDNGGYLYTFDANKKFVPQPYNYLKANNNDVRVLSYNVLKDNLFNSSLRQPYKRIFQSIEPDIIGLCEIYDNSSSQTASLIESFLPSSGGKKWYHAEVNPDIRVVSRYPIVNSRSIDGNGAFHIDMGDKQLLFIVAHLPCCDNETGRQAEIDKIMAFVRSVKFGISPFQIPLNAPIIIVGDMNLVGLRQQVNTLLTGDIINNNNFGPDFKPDWDNSDFEDAKPGTTELPFTFTWYNDFGSYSAGRLDYIIYTGSRMSLSNCFALWSPVLPTDKLLSTGLQKYDVPNASDHLPIVADFDLSGNTSTSLDTKITHPFTLRYVDDQLLINSDYIGKVLLSDLTGRVIIETYKNAPGEIAINVPSFSGIYIFSFYTNNGLFSSSFFR